MADEDQGTMQMYKFGGHKDADNGINTLIAEGTVLEPKRYASKGEVIELSEEEAEMYKSQGLKLTKKDGEDVRTQAEVDAEPQEIKTHEDQIKAQPASGAQGAPASSETDNTPAGRAAAGKK